MTFTRFDNTQNRMGEDRAGRWCRKKCGWPISFAPTIWIERAKNAFKFYVTLNFQYTRAVLIVRLLSHSTADSIVNTRNILPQNASACWERNGHCEGESRRVHSHNVCNPTANYLWHGNPYRIVCSVRRHGRLSRPARIMSLSLHVGHCTTHVWYIVVFTVHRLLKGERERERTNESFDLISWSFCCARTT